MYVLTDDTGRICATTDLKEFANGMVEFEFPSDFDFTKQDEYRIIDNKLIYEPRQESSESQIIQLKSNLSETDYIIIKMVEATISGYKISEGDTALYSLIMQQRQAWRDKINLLESKEGT